MTLAVEAKVSKGMTHEQMKGFNLLDAAPTHGEHTTGALREKMGSPRYDYMPSRIVNEAYGRVAEFGAVKYAARNWEKGLPMSQISSSLQRHLFAFMDGEDKDPESGLSHLDHMLWNAVALVYGEYHDLCDDRMPMVDRTTAISEKRT